MSTDLKYRPDIDGLRAVAVLGVVLFHLDPAWLPGGFTGVDIFFVISGYLITSIIAREMGAGRFSFARFYQRRILRIAPAYFVVTAVTLVAGAFLLLPADLAELSRSALWSAVSLPNVYFWAFLDTGYFAAESEEMPLLHLWSLGVEEQFYLLWPLVLLLLQGLRKQRWVLIGLLSATAAVSFVHAQHMALVDPTYAYYMLPARAGALLLGATLALLVQDAATERTGPAWLELVCGVGLLMIAAGFLAIDEQTVFPGYATLLPCVGTALVIYSGTRRNCQVMRPLTVRPMLMVGLISYSFYLWHWPVLAYARYFASDLGTGELLACAVTMLVLSALSYRFVEVPFRNFRMTAAGWKAPAGYAVSVTLLAAGAYLMVHTRGLESLIQSSPAYVAGLKRLEQETAAANTYPYNCQDGAFDPKQLSRPECVIGPKDAAPRVLLIGDSNAAHFVGVIGALAEKTGDSFRNASFSGCPPVLAAKAPYIRPDRAADCLKYRANMRRSVARYDTVVLGAQWSVYMRQDGFAQDLHRTVRMLARDGRRVVLMGQVPRFPSFDRSCDLRAIRLPLVDCAERARLSAIPDHKANAMLRKIVARTPGAYYFAVNDVICGELGCSPYQDGALTYFDRSHLSMSGSWRIGRIIAERYPEGRSLGAILESSGAVAAARPAAAARP